MKNAALRCLEAIPYPITSKTPLRGAVRRIRTNLGLP
jgi:hypothetical protein